MRVHIAAYVAGLLSAVLGGCCPTHIDFTSYWTASQQHVTDSAWPGEIKSSGAEHVLILPGIRGMKPPLTDDSIGGAHTRRLRGLVERSGRSAQIWDWTRIVPQKSDLQNLCDDLNAGRARILAKRLNAWHRQHSSVRLSLIAMSGGSNVAWELCNSAELTDELGFTKIILLSGSVSSKRGSYAFTDSLQDNGAFLVYASTNDDVLGSGLGRILTPNAVGLSGYNGTAARVRELHWSSSMQEQPWNNNGKHLHCLKEEFMSKCVVPALAADATDWPQDCRRLQH